MDKKLLDILRCPVCKGVLYYDKKAAELMALFKEKVAEANDSTYID